MNELGMTRDAALAGRREAPPATRAFRPAVWSTVVDGRRYVVKDYAAAAWIYRWTLGRFELLREQRAYERLAGLSFVPRCYGRLDRHALLLEHVEARTLPAAAIDLQPKAMEQLYSAVAAMHSRGILHNDLRHRTNILVDTAGDVRLIDFAGSIDVRRGWRHWLFGWLAFVDRSAVVKWWLRYFPECVPQLELDWYRRYLRLRTLWPVRNPGLRRQAEQVRQLRHLPCGPAPR